MADTKYTKTVQEINGRHKVYQNSIGNKWQTQSIPNRYTKQRKTINIYRTTIKTYRFTIKEINGRVVSGAWRGEGGTMKFDNDLT